MRSVRGVYSDKYRVFVALVKELHVDMAAMPIYKEKPIVTSISSLWLTVLVEYLLEPCETKLVACLAIW